MTPSLVSISRSMLKMTHAAPLDLTTQVPLKHSITDLSIKMKLYCIIVVVIVVVIIVIIIIIIIIIISGSIIIYRE